MAGRLFFSSIAIRHPRDHEMNERIKHDNLLLFHKRIGFCPTIAKIKRDLMRNLPD
jgi:hypothetical protein